MSVLHCILLFIFFLFIRGITFFQAHIAHGESNNFLEEGWHEDEQGVQTPVKGEVGHNDAPHSRGQHDLEPRNRNLQGTARNYIAYFFIIWTSIVPLILLCNLRTHTCMYQISSFFSLHNNIFNLYAIF